jgi:hypothetical protein
VIAEDLTLRGAGVGRIRSPQTLPAYGTHLPDGRALTAVVRVGNAAHVRLSTSQ